MAELLMPVELLLRRIDNLEDGSEDVPEVMLVAMNKYWKNSTREIDLIRRDLAFSPMDEGLTEGDYKSLHSAYVIISKSRELGAGGGAAVHVENGILYSVRFEATKMPPKGESSQADVLDILKRTRTSQGNLRVGDIAYHASGGPRIGEVMETTVAGVVVNPDSGKNWEFHFHGNVRKEEG